MGVVIGWAGGGGLDEIKPERVVLVGELSQASTQAVPSTLAIASAAVNPVAAMRPPLRPWVKGRRPRWKATSRVCLRVRHLLAYPHAISPAHHHRIRVLNEVGAQMVNLKGERDGGGCGWEGVGGTVLMGPGETNVFLYRLYDYRYQNRTIFLQNYRTPRHV